jgi:hypothetical protein
MTRCPIVTRSSPSGHGFDQAFGQTPDVPHPFPPSGATSLSDMPHTIEMRFADGGVIVLTLAGELDQEAGAALEEAAAAVAASDDTTRLDIDLRSLTSFTPEGADALVACRSLATSLAGGLHYRTGRGPGRAALLAAYARR